MDRFLAGLLTEKEEYKRDEILKLMGEKQAVIQCTEIV